MSAPPLKIYTASAGSGKTYALVREYLRLALDGDPRSYQGIQAVTFTRKATAEMKERILGELHQLSQGRSRMAAELLRELGCSSSELERRARLMLRTLLEEYQRFRIRTIDSFFQELIRSFAHELGHSGALRLETDTAYVHSYAIQALFADIDQGKADKTLRDWIMHLALDSIDQGRSIRVETGLKNFAGQLEREAVKKQLIAGTFPHHEDLDALEQSLRAYRAWAKAEVTRIHQGLLDELQRAGLTLQDLSYGEQGTLAAVLHAAKLEGTSLLKAKAPLTSAKRWQDWKAKDYSAEALLKKGQESKAAGLSAATLAELGAAFDELCRDHAPSLEAVTAMLRQLSFYRLLIKIKEKLDTLRNTERLSVLSDAPTLIAHLLRHVDPGQSPFFYERIGTRIAHHMIDEFQDTSQMQYENFLPLLREAVGNGQDSLLVGDAKQSIYRFRNADSRLLSSVGSYFGEEAAETIPLDTNWRSTPEIIHFNNALYPELARLLADQQQVEESGLGAAEQQRLRQLIDQSFGIYSTEQVAQQVPEAHAERAGLVALHYTDLSGAQEAEGQAPDTEDSEEGEVDASRYQSIIPVILDLQRRGYRPCDIAILVRGSKEAQAIAEVLQTTVLTREEAECCSLDFTSQEALILGGAYSVGFLIAVFRYIAQPSSRYHRTYLQLYYEQLRLQKEQELGSEEAPHLPELEEAGELAESFLATLAHAGRRGLFELGELLIHYFGRLLLEAEEAYVIFFLELLQQHEAHEGSDLAAFLSYWDERGSGLTIVAPEDERNLRLMTIHKSKGLDFPAVLLPDLDWKIYDGGRRAEMLWCPLERERFPEELQLPMRRDEELGAVPRVAYVPVEATSSLAYSTFAPEYYEDRVNRALDALNLLYVATTRPARELHLWLPQPEEAKEKPQASTVAELLTILGLEELLSSLGGSSPRFVTTPATDPLAYSLPELPSYSPKGTAAEEGLPLRIQQLEAYPSSRRIAVLREGLDHFIEDSPIRNGRVMHGILERITTTADISAALDEAVLDGLVSEEHRPNIQEQLEAITTAEATRRWFDGSGRVRTEATIIGGERHEVRRPDRIVFYEDEQGERVELVDYKFGKPQPGYPAQVRRYMQLMRAMGYERVTGYLCYITEGELQVKRIS